MFYFFVIKQTNLTQKNRKHTHKGKLGLSLTITASWSFFSILTLKLSNFWRKRPTNTIWLPILFDGGPLVGGVNNFNLPKKINSNKAEIANSLALKFYSYRIHNWISIIDYAGKSPNVDSTHGTVPNCENSKKNTTQALYWNLGYFVSDVSK